MALAVAGRGSAADDWFPLDAGRTLAYATHRDRTIERPGEPVRRQFFHGTTETTVLGSTARDAGRIQLRVVRREWEASLARSAWRSQEEIQIYSHVGRDLLLHAQLRPDDTRDRVVYDPPVRILEDPLDAGRSWTVGELREDGLRIDARAEVIGRETVTIAGRVHPESVHVRYHGNVAGWLAADDDRLTVTEGRYVQEIWFARGVGPVREATTIDLRLRNEGGVSTRLSDVFTRTLQESGDADAHAAP